MMPNIFTVELFRKRAQKKKVTLVIPFIDFKKTSCRPSPQHSKIFKNTKRKVDIRVWLSQVQSIWLCSHRLSSLNSFLYCCWRLRWEKYMKEVLYCQRNMVGNKNTQLEQCFYRKKKKRLSSVVRDRWSLSIRKTQLHQNLPLQPLLQKTRHLEVDRFYFRRHCIKNLFCPILVTTDWKQSTAGVS